MSRNWAKVCNILALLVIFMGIAALLKSAPTPVPSFVAERVDYYEGVVPPSLYGDIVAWGTGRDDLVWVAHTYRDGDLVFEFSREWTLSCNPVLKPAGVPGRWHLDTSGDLLELGDDWIEWCEKAPAITGCAPNWLVGCVLDHLEAMGCFDGLKAHYVARIMPGYAHLARAGT